MTAALSPQDVAGELGVSVTTAYRIFRDDKTLRAFSDEVSR